ncbi:MAG: hypothetical protein Q8N99_05515 [Nanoarchaeota archaeon]|nr:hypothetical protein [Nanoarchaeota archaeon]
MRNLVFAGYYKDRDAAFDFCYITDKMLLEAMQTLRKDRYLLCDWNDINPDLSSDNVYDWTNKKRTSYYLKDADSVIILEVPTKTSAHTTVERVFPLLEEIARRGIPGVNPARAVVDFSDKSYFTRYPNLPFPKTFSVNGNLEASLSQLGASVVIKPIDTDSGYGVERLQNDLELVRKYIAEHPKDAPFIVQEFVSEIAEGERSLYFFAKQFRYAMIKRPKQGEFRSNWRYVDLLAPYIPTDIEIDIAKNAIDTINSPSVLERVDMVSSGRIIEMTLDCPGLYLEEAGINGKIGNWFYQAVDASIRRAT